MKTKKKFSGVIIPAVTPLTAEYRLDVEAVERIFISFRKSNVSPFILGTTGEAPSIPASLKLQYLETAARLKQPGDVYYGGISSNCFDDSVEFAKACVDKGIDVLVATLPSYYQLTDAQMFKYFESMAHAVTVPLVIYNIPATTHMSIPLNIIETLSHHPNIVGVKDSERSDDRLSESLRLWSHRADFSHFIGWAARSAEAILNGSDGLVPSTGNFYPGLYDSLFKAAMQGNREEALMLQKLSDTLGDIYQKGRTLGESLWALKVVMHISGLCEPYVFPPLQPMQEDEMEKLIHQYNTIKAELTI